MKSSIVALTIVGVSFLITDVSGQSSARTAAEQRNVDRASEWLLDVFSGMKVDRWKDYVAEDLIEHNPCCTGGLAELLKFFTPPRPPRPRPEPVHTIVDGDLVLFVLPGAVTKNENNPSRLKQQLRIELIRMRDGKQAEHWDNVRKAPQGAAANAIDQPAVNGRNAMEQRNLKFVMDVWNNAFLPLDLTKLRAAYADNHVEYHPCCTNITETMNFFAALKQKMPKGIPPTRFTHQLVDGELVALIFVSGTEPDAKDKTKMHERLSLEVFRVRNDKFVEHWPNERHAPAGATVTQ